MKRYLLCLAVTTSVFAADVQERLRDNESRQQELRSQVATVGQQLDTVLAEFDRNGLGGGSDTVVLRQIRGVLDKLSAEQMQKVVEFLQTAQSAASVDTASASVRDAHAQQQAIVAQLGTLLIEYQRQQGVQGLAARFEKLADRQHAAMNATVTLAVATAGKPATSWQALQKNTQQMGRSEQDGINADAKEAFDVLAQLAATDGTSEDQLRKALALIQDRTLPKQMADASDAITQGALYRAATGQKTVRDSLYDLSDLVSPPKSPVEAMRDAQEALERLADQQKALQDDTADTKNHDLKFETQQAEATLVDKTDRVQRKLAALTSDAADETKAAQKDMNQARADLAKSDRDTAKTDQSKAIEQLKKAVAVLDTEIAKAEKIDEPPVAPPDDKLAAAKEMAEKATELQKEQQAATAEAKADPAKAADMQKQVTEKAKDLAKEAAAQEDSAPAAPDLTEAAKQSDQAKAQLADAKTPDAKTPDSKIADAKTPNTPAAPQTTQPASPQTADAAKPDAAKPDAGKPQDAKADAAKPDAAKAADAQKASQAAIDSAVTKLQKKVDDLQKDQAELAQAQEAKDAVDDVLKAQQAQNQKTDDAAAAKQSASDQAKPQTDIAQQASTAADKAAAAAPEAQQPMQDAKGDMQKAASQLGKDQPAAAQGPQKDAVASLQKASTALDKKIADMQKALGQSPDSATAQNADAQQALTDAQEKTAAAAGQMDQGQNKDAAGKMQDAAAGLQQAAAQDGHAPADAKAAMQAAAGSLQQAAGQAKAGQGQAAGQSMAQANQQMAAAAASLAAQASAMGMSQSQMASAASKAKANKAMKGMVKSTKQADGARASNGQSGGTATGGRQAYAGLPQRDRQALMQSQADKYPQEFATDIERYLHNLSDTDKK